MTSAIITNPFYIQGRIDGNNRIPFNFKIQINNLDPSPEDFIEYCKGYGSMYATVDYSQNIISNILSWPQYAQDEYTKQYKILEFLNPN